MGEVRGEMTEDGTGTTDAEAVNSKLPEKVIGEHRWTLMAAFSIDGDKAKQIYDRAMEQKKNGVRTDWADGVLDGLDVMAVQGIGCYDCVQPYQIVHKRRCPAAAVKEKA